MNSKSGNGKGYGGITVFGNRDFFRSLGDGFTFVNHKQDTSQFDPITFSELSQIAAQLGPWFDLVESEDEDESEAELLVAMRTRIGNVTPDSSLIEAMMRTPDGAFTIQWSMRWYKNAFPTVDIDPKVAASYACTSMRTGSIELELLEAPWRAFAIALPEPLLTLMRDDGTEDPVHTIRVYRWANSDRWSIFLNSDSLQAWARGLPTANLLDEQDPDEENSDSWYETSKHDERAILLARRIVRGVLFAMNDKNERDHMRAKRPSSKAQRRAKQRAKAKGTPLLDKYVLTAAISIDCRPVVRAYITGASRKVTIRSIVRGHFRHQRYGPRNSRVKRVHIQPHERGPKGAPLAVRPHHLLGGAESAAK
jgi:hypothetical protein